MLSLVTFVIVLSILILVHELGHFMVAKKSGVRVEAFSLGFGRKLLSFKHKGTEYRLSLIPLGGYVKMAGETPYEAGNKGASDEFMSKSIFARASVLAAGPIFNYLLGFLLFALVFMAGNPQVTSKIGGIMNDYPAKQAGIKEGDRIVELNGKKIVYWEEVLDIIHKNTQGSMSLKVDRAGKEMIFNLDPKVKEFKNIFGQQVKIGLLGIAPSDEIIYVRHNPLKSVYMALEKTWDITWMTYLSLWRIITGGMSFKESVTGPIGIFMVTSKVATAGLAYVIGFMAILSISLGIFNLLPIPILDGGHIFFLIIEKIRGKVVSEKIYERVNQIGMMFLIALMIFVIYNDALRAGWVNKITSLTSKVISNK